MGIASYFDRGNLPAPPGRAYVAVFSKGGRLPVANSFVIAVVGISCRCSKASSPDAFWRLLRGGASTITDTPADRCDLDELSASGSAASVIEGAVGGGGGVVFMFPSQGSLWERWRWSCWTARLCSLSTCECVRTRFGLSSTPTGLDGSVPGYEDEAGVRHPLF